MKIPEPKKISKLGEPEKWFMQVMVDRKRQSRVFRTAEDAIYWAAGIKTKSAEDDRSPRTITVTEAIDRYIQTKDAVLSPSTIAGYRKIQRNLMTAIATVKLQDLTQEKIQRWVNTLAKEKSPKTIQNAHGLLSAVLAEYKPSVSLRTTLPQKVKTEVLIPSEKDVAAIINASRGTKYELPIMLAIWLGLRQSEILGLTWDCIDSEYLHVKKAVVMGENGPVEKGTKSYSGTRKIRLPQYLKELIEAQPQKDNHIILLSAKSIYSGFCRICEKAGVPHYRFHDLRHLNASAMLANHVPDKYSMKRMGHATNNMLKTVYQHTIKEKEIEYDNLIDSYFEKLLKTGGE